jgi:CRP-like cAMP-binding protein
LCRVYGPLQFFGEMAMMLDAAHGRVALSFHASTFCSIVHLNRHVLRRLLAGHPRIELRLKQARACRAVTPSKRCAWEHLTLVGCTAGCRSRGRVR